MKNSNIRLNNIKSTFNSKIVSVELEDYPTYDEFKLDFKDYDVSESFLSPNLEDIGLILGYPDISLMIYNIQKIKVPYSLIIDISQSIGSPYLHEILDFIESNYIGEFDGIEDFIQSYLHETPLNPYGYWVENCENMYSHSDNKYFFRLC